MKCLAAGVPAQHRRTHLTSARALRSADEQAAALAVYRRCRDSVACLGAQPAAAALARVVPWLEPGLCSWGVRHPYAIRKVSPNSLPQADFSWRQRGVEMMRLTMTIRQVVWLAAACAALPAAAAPVFLNPLTTNTLIEAFAVNTLVQPGVHCNTRSSGPIADAASQLHLTSTADASAAVSAVGLHAAASVHNTSGVVGSQATISIDYHLGGSLNDTPGCPICFGFIQADLGVDGMGEQFRFLGSRTMGTAGKPKGNISGVNIGGTLSGLVPLNTQIYLRAGLCVRAACQAPPTCDASALFGGTLGCFGFSPSQLDIVWGLAQRALPPVSGSVPEPASRALLATGLVALGVRPHRRGG